MIPDMDELLRRSGYVTRGKNRATCTACSGRDQMTVSFTDDVFHCHRCHAKGSRMGLARRLGLLSQEKMTPRERLVVTAEIKQQVGEAKKLPGRAAFKVWRSREELAATDECRLLGRMAAVAAAVLRVHPEAELEWGMLARWYDAEAEIGARLELMFLEKACTWMPHDPTPADVLEAWRGTL